MNSVVTGIATHDQKVPKGPKPRPPPKYDSSVYEQLKTKWGHIRILKLLASSPENPYVECELVVTEFTESSEAIPYEALSWCWGTSRQTSYINIRKDGNLYAKHVSRSLLNALRALRRPKKDCYFWIDAVCIDQDNLQEKNHQVEMMSEIYGRASRVCIWLGERDKSSEMALKFIKTEILQLQNFDELCADEQSSEKWGALLDLMQRPWFSRRWVVQEVALARKAVIYCGVDKISWREFAVAVELFVEVETATHRLSEVMRKDPKFYHVPGWFEYVSALGATLLVEATGILFRDYRHRSPAHHKSYPKPKPQPGSGSDSESDDGSDIESEVESVAESVAEAHSDGTRLGKRQPLLSLEYLVSRLSIFEATVGHDIIYALLAISKDTTPFSSEGGSRIVLNHTQDILEAFTQQKRYKVEYEKPFVDVCRGFVEFCIQRGDPTRALDIICRPWAPEPKRKPARRNSRNPDKARDRASGEKGREDKTVEEDLPLPSWIPRLSGAPFAMFPHAGIHKLKMGRKNADTFVGLPASNQRNYNAAESKRFDIKKLKFRKRKDHYSMYVEGFVLDTVKEVQPFSQGGAIPHKWAEAGGWHDAPNTDPPHEFWRTLVGDRGQDGKNPPVYYSRACKESFSKGGLSSGSVSTTDLINNERCSVVAQFCRRVQSVIWNRCLIKTKGGNLGLANSNIHEGYLVCILYGCSVPVILRQSEKKTPNEIDDEVADEMRHRKTEWFLRWKKNATRRRVFREMRERERKWEMNMRKAYYREKGAVEYSGKQSFEKWRKETRRKIEENPYFRETEGVAVENKLDYENWKREKRDEAKREGKEKEWNEPRGDKYWYKFLGECYIHGMMDGEAMARQNKDGLPMEVFELR
ncbi:HET-domain-containing protein [Glonium stellatum]|uniref:HET-domain-containing protein n=1 Tax=Glonium stellatum TaxID=574774 RepID=A0A8E2FD42_9PEZI|nr:HET-domain-containing protein [Glonium stellatum]